MSTTAIAPSNGVPEGELAIAQRVQQLQALIEQTRDASISGVTGGPRNATLPMNATAAASTAAGNLAMSTATAPSTGDFAAALQAATAADSSTTAAQSAPSGGLTTGQGAATGGSSEYDPLIEQAAARYGLDPAVLHGLIQQESGFDPSAQSSAGASGLTQLMPGTAASLGVANPLNPSESIEGGARYLSQMMSQFGGNTEEALAAYNAGPGAVQQYGGIPPYAETQSYVSKVLGYAESYRQTHPSSISPGGLA